MKKISSNLLIDDLTADVREIIVQATKLKALDDDALRQHPPTGGWNIAQVVHHLNFYSDHYLNAIENKLHHSPTTSAKYFHPGWLGNYFTKVMKPSEGGVVKNKMKTMKVANPPGDIDGYAALTRFISDQHHLINLLNISRSVSLGKIRIPTSVSRLLTFKLGDTFRFLIGHEQRHFLQIENIIKSSGITAVAAE